MFRKYSNPQGNHAHCSDFKSRGNDRTAPPPSTGLAGMAGSLGVLDIERVVIAAVRAALQGVAPPVQSTSTVSAPAVPSATGTSNFAATVTSLRSAPLPSIPRHNRAQSGYLRRRNVKIYTKDVVCLTFSPGESVFIIPRGETRTRLATAGLVGKISFSTEWSEDQVRAEITAIFSGAFGLSEHQSLPFQFLSTIKGCKKLMIPKVTSNFPWGGKEVASVCSSTCLYIMAEMEVPAQNWCVELSDDSDFESPVVQRRRVTQREASSRAQREHCERLERVEASAPSDDGMELQGQQGPNEAMNHFSVTQREASSRAQREHCERLERVEASAPSDDGMELQGQRGPNEAMNYFADFIPTDIEEDEEIEEAIRRSLLEESVQSLQDSRFAESLSKEEMTGIVKAHSERVVTEAFRPIYISRGNVWTTALRQFSRRKFTQCTDLLYVTFASDEGTNEDGADLGGPRREFFRLLVKAIFKESGAFEESLNGFTPRMNISHVQNGVYRTIGQMMSTIIVQGGEPPALLSPLVVDYLLTGSIFQLKVTPDDVADMVLREALKKVDQALTTDELEQAVECCDSWRYQLEGLPNPVSMDNKDAFVQNAILFYVLIQRQSCYDQLVEGLKYYEVLPLLKERPCLRVLLHMPKEPSDVPADVVATLLKPNYSVLGSNRRPTEELMVVKFREFLHCVQEKELGEHLNARNLTEAEKVFILTLNPGHILAFATGSSKVPAIGFSPSPKLTFVHDDTKHLPIAHTCSNELQIFVNRKNLADDNEFDYIFLVALMNGSTFSAV
ncbi:G2/M phase-specific E3 ubiquitin-protein ligase [Merluccius polli]|uniref:HECT-type E3 ubiquitin transferase n=1 Tax=Merluccius polli TaxID=89951 RepID=A0AA47NU61_MERPO|nr:G2/M phase-specific E3 ubiquitin-protein ligase [Merluccius polli]